MDLAKLSSKIEDEYASYIEEFIATRLAPETISDQGRVSIIVIWIVLSIVFLIGGSKLE